MSPRILSTPKAMPILCPVNCIAHVSVLPFPLSIVAIKTGCKNRLLGSACLPACPPGFRYCCLCWSSVPLSLFRPSLGFFALITVAAAAAVVSPFGGAAAAVHSRRDGVKALCRQQAAGGRHASGGPRSGWRRGCATQPDGITQPRSQSFVRRRIPPFSEWPPYSACRQRQQQQQTDRETLLARKTKRECRVPFPVVNALSTAVRSQLGEGGVAAAAAADPLGGLFHKLEA